MKSLNVWLPLVLVLSAVGGAIAYVKTTAPAPVKPAQVEEVAEGPTTGWSNGPTSSIYSQSAAR